MSLLTLQALKSEVFDNEERRVLIHALTMQRRVLTRRIEAIGTVQNNRKVNLTKDLQTCNDLIRQIQ